MNNSFFEVLKDEFADLYNMGKYIEENIYTNSSAAITKSRLFAEKLLINVAEIEELYYLKTVPQYERIRELHKEGIISDKILSEFDFIRITGNKAIHEGTNNDIEYSVKIYKKLYVIVKWFFETYASNHEEIVPEYEPAKFPNRDGFNLDQIDNIIKRKIEEYIESSNKKKLVQEKGIERDASLVGEELEIEEAAMKILGYEYTDKILAEDTKDIDEEIIINSNNTNINEEEKKYIYTYKKLKGSYLLNELSKLSESAKEAVESCTELDTFKKYLHVDRNIQNELLELIKEANNSEQSQLVLLCGSVGDGKSHLLAYVNEEYKEIISNFKIHNDATESFDPSQTEIETLKKVLSGFSDKNIEKTNEKLILAINLGVLNNFLQADGVKEEYTKLIEFINNSNIFNQEKISKSSSSNNFKLVSFGDYNIYELTAEGPKSKYIKSLLYKIVDKNDNNPFYNAFRKDIEEKLDSPVIENYKILSIEGVVDKVTQIIIKAMVKNKRILGTRELLNFIYELIVPANIDEFDITSSSIDYIDAILPNMIFNSKERGALLKLISIENPLGLRHEKLDQLIVTLNIASNLKHILSQYFDDSTCEIIEVILGDIYSLNDVSEALRQKYIDTIIRFAYILGNEAIQEIFEDSAYNDYMKYLYYYNCGMGKEYKIMFDEVENAIYKWNGSPKKHYIYLNEKLENFNVAEQLKIKATNKKGMCEKFSSECLERFKSNITLGYEIVGRELYETLDVDYQLYKKIVEVNNGYHVTKNDKEQGVLFVEFIDKLLLNGNMENELLIEDKRNNRKFSLIYENDFDEEFIFERMES